MGMLRRRRPGSLAALLGAALLLLGWGVGSRLQRKPSTPGSVSAPASPPPVFSPAEVLMLDSVEGIWEGKRPKPGAYLAAMDEAVATGWRCEQIRQEYVAIPPDLSLPTEVPEGTRVFKRDAQGGLVELVEVQGDYYLPEEAAREQARIARLEAENARVRAEAADRQGGDGR